MSIDGARELWVGVTQVLSEIFHESSFGLPLGIIASHAISLGSRVREVSISLLCHRPSDRDSEILRPV